MVQSLHADRGGNMLGMSALLSDFGNLICVEVIFFDTRCHSIIDPSLAIGVYKDQPSRVWDKPISPTLREGSR